MLSRLMRVNLITAIDKNNGIARKNKIPWRIKEDYNFFMDVTKKEYVKNKKNAVIMGKNTWKQLPDSFRGLKDRINVVVSSTMSNDELNNDNYTKSDVHLVNSLDQSLDLCRKLDVGKIFIGGGSNIYKEALLKNIVDEIYLTKIDKDYNCDTFFNYDDCINYIKKMDFMNISDKHFNLVDTLNLTDNNKVNVIFQKFVKKQYVDEYNVNKEEQNYLNLLEDILKNGDYRQTRNAFTYSLFAKTLEFDLSKGFPLLTTKKMFLRGIFEELMFFLRGDTNAKHLSDIGVKIWDGNTSREFLDSVGLNHYEEGDMGPLYSFQWSFYGLEYKGMNHDYSKEKGGFNQIKYCLELIKKDPNNRRILLTSYNPIQAQQSVLFPCHSLTCQFYVERGNRLSLACYNRSQDYVCGNPFNNSSSALLVYLFCEVINNDKTYKGPKLTPGRLIMNLGDTHVYDEHYSEAIRQLLREPCKFPQLKFKRKVTELTDFKFEDLELIDYNCYPALQTKMIA